MLVLGACAGTPGLVRGETYSAGDSDLRIAVRVINLANVDQATVAYAEKEAARILRDAGVETHWSDCPVADVRAERNPVCGKPETPSELVMRIVARFSGDAQGDSGPATLGMAVVLEKPRHGTLAAVSFHRVSAMTARKQVAPYMVLGHAMAHEIGHLLLGIPTHSQNGLMRAAWNSTDLQRAALGKLRFSREESESIRAAVRERIEYLGQAVQPLRAAN
jgi:hypothetical protein